MYAQAEWEGTWRHIWGMQSLECLSESFRRILCEEGFFFFWGGAPGPQESDNSGLCDRVELHTDGKGKTLQSFK